MKLKQLRELNHMTQRQAAEAIGCTQGNYSRYETGEREPSIELLVRMATAFGVSVDYLIGNADVDDMVLSTYERNLILAARAADSRARQDAMLLLTTHQKK